MGGEGQAVRGSKRTVRRAEPDRPRAEDRHRARHVSAAVGPAPADERQQVAHVLCGESRDPTVSWKHSTDRCRENKDLQGWTSFQ
eukprot:4435830-Amphidinium_carterae.1